jgi:hypothetical protein
LTVTALSFRYEQTLALVGTYVKYIIAENPIHLLRDAVVSFNDFFTGVIVLIDDLDKGWPPRQVESHDIVTVLHLIEVLNRIQRDLSRRRIVLRYLIF